MSPRRGCFPGSFDPLTVAHLALAEAALEQCALANVDVVLSRAALGKTGHTHSLDERVAMIRHAAASRPWLGVVVTDKQLLADIADGYDVLIVGADKWHQLHDPAFYGGSVEAMDRALARLPAVACAPRADLRSPPGVTSLALPDELRHVSATAVRAGATHWRAR